LLPARVGQPVARFGGGRKWARRKAIVAASLSGIFPIVVTPFHGDGSVDFESQDRLVEHLLEQGAHGLGLFGNASEGYTLAAEERATIMKRVARRVAGRVLACCLAIALARYWWPT
jgi:dihydrodipicolinate synthase/N-acetylneuraminate lyase